jgi:hypothetical protein
MNGIWKALSFAALCLTMVSGHLFAQDFVDQAAQLGVDVLVSGSELGGSGLSVYDFDEDGLDDISICTSTGQLKFYHNTGNGFELLSLGVIAAGITEHLVWVDVDNDNDLDIYFTTFQGRQFLYLNNGDFQFEEATAASGLPLYTGYYFGASFADYDLDGDLDLYTSKYNLDNVNPSDISQYNKLFQNQGDGTFIDVTLSAGVFKPPTLSFQSVWLDYNDDGWPDIHVINDRSPVNFFFHNNGDGTFSEIAGALGIGFPGNDVMSNSVADFDQDGDLDIFMTNTGVVNQGTHSLFLVNQGNESFEELAEEYGIADYVTGWGAVWIDADNDTWQDLFFVTESELSFYYHKNNQGESFTESNDLISVGEFSTSYCSSKGDFNNDGYADIAIQSENPHPPYVLMNQGGENNYIKVTLQGTLSNTKAIGSWVKVYVGNAVYVEYTHCGENYLGQNSQHLIFGLGPDVSVVDSVQVIYPSRHVDTYYELLSDTSYVFTEGETYICEITSANEALEICEGDSILIDAGEHISYLWNTGDTARTIWVNSASTYTVSTQNLYGILATDSIEITENLNPLISSMTTNPLCNGDSTASILLTNLTGVAADSIVWSTGEVSDMLQNIPAGNYGYTYYDINGCRTSGSVPILEPSAMTFFATSTPEIDENENGSISISVFGGTPPYDIYLDTILVSNQIDSLPNGDYNFTIVDANMCTDTLSILVDFLVNTDVPEKIIVELYPNPVSNVLTIQSQQSIEDVSVLNTSGQMVKQFSQTQNNQYSFTDLPNGTYIVRITLANKGIAVYRIVKI